MPSIIYNIQWQTIVIWEEWRSMERSYNVRGYNTSFSDVFNRFLCFIKRFAAFLPVNDANFFLTSTSWHASPRRCSATVMAALFLHCRPWNIANGSLQCSNHNIRRLTFAFSAAVNSGFSVIPICLCLTNSLYFDSLFLLLIAVRFFVVLMVAAFVAFVGLIYSYGNVSFALNFRFYWSKVLI